MIANVQLDLKLVDDIIVYPFLPLLVEDQLFKHLFVINLVSYCLVNLLPHQLKPTLLLSYYLKLWSDCSYLELQMFDFLCLL